MSLMDGNVNSQSRHGSSASPIISTTSSNSHFDGATKSSDSHSDTMASCEDIVQSVQQKMNTDTEKY